MSDFGALTLALPAFLFKKILYSDIRTDGLYRKPDEFTRPFDIWQQKIGHSIAKVLQHSNAGQVVRVDHHDWYAELFGPSVTAGILERSQLAGYRTGQIFIRNSMHTPVPREAVFDSLEALFDLLSEEPQACVRAVLDGEASKRST